MAYSRPIQAPQENLLTGGWTRALPITGGLLALLIMTLLWFGMQHVRGVDQYWYLADTQTLIDNGQPVTNTVFPGMVLRANSSDITTYFLHNSPVLHLNAWIGQLAGAFSAWKLSNGVMLLLTALLIGSTVNHLAGSRWAYAAYAMHIASPLAVWQASNLFQESFLVLLMSALTYIFIRRQQLSAAPALLTLLLAIGSMSHPAFVILAGLHLVWALIDRQDWTFVTVSAVIYSVALSLKTVWFPSSFQPDLSSIITSSIPDATNMMWHLSASSAALDAELMWLKLTDAVRLQFLTIEYWPFTCLTNLGVLAFFWLLCFRRQRYAGLLMIIALQFGLLAGMLILMQNLPRYQLTAAPASVISIVLMAANMPWQRLMACGLIAGLGLFLVADHKLMHYLDLSARIEQQAAQRILEQLGPLPEHYRVALVDSKATDRYVPVVTALAPRAVLLADQSLLNAKEFQQLLLLFEPDLVVSAADSLVLPADTAFRHIEHGPGNLTNRLEAVGVHWFSGIRLMPEPAK